MTSERKKKGRGLTADKFGCGIRHKMPSLGEAIARQDHRSNCEIKFGQFRQLVSISSIVGDLSRSSLPYFLQTFQRLFAALCS